MGSQKMVEHVEECENMGLVLTLLAGAYVGDDHVANDFTAAIAVHEIDGKAGSSDLGHVLMLRDGKNLCFSQAGKGYAVIKVDHQASSAFGKPQRWQRSASV